MSDREINIDGEKEQEQQAVEENDVDPFDLDAEIPDPPEETAAEEPPEQQAGDTGQQTAEDTGEPPAEEQIDVAALKSQVEQLAREKAAMVAKTRDERAKRQELQGRIDQITEHLAHLREAQQKSAKDDQAASAAEDDQFVDLDFDEEGNARVPVDSLKTVISKETQQLSQKIADLEAQLEAANQALAQRDMVQRQNEALNNLLSQNKAYPAAYKDLVARFRDIDQTFTQYLEQNDIDPPQTTEEAIDMIVSSQPVMEQITAKYPGLDVETVLESTFYGTPRKVRKALNHIVKTSGSKKKPESKTASIAGKPETLARVASAGADEGGGTNVDRFADMDPFDAVTLSDSQIKELERQIRGLR